MARKLPAIIRAIKDHHNYNRDVSKVAARCAMSCRPYAKLRGLLTLIDNDHFVAPTKPIIHGFFVDGHEANLDEIESGSSGPFGGLNHLERRLKQKTNGKWEL